MTRRAKERRIGAQLTDISKGHAAIVGKMPTLLLDARRASTTVWPADIGTDASGIEVPTYSATAWNSSLPAVQLTAATSDAISLPLAATRNADPDLPFTIGASIQLGAATDRWLFSWGRTSAADPLYGVYIDASRNVGFFASTNAASTEINELGSSTLSASTRYSFVCTYSGSGGRFRCITRDSAGETVRLSATGLATLSSSANYTLDYCYFGKRVDNASPADVDIGQLVVWDGLAVTDAQMTSIATQLAVDYTVA